jgi:hypothetical protein
MPATMARPKFNPAICWQARDGRSSLVVVSLRPLQVIDSATSWFPVNPRAAFEYFPGLSKGGFHAKVTPS